MKLEKKHLKPYLDYTISHSIKKRNYTEVQRGYFGVKSQ